MIRAQQQHPNGSNEILLVGHWRSRYFADAIAALRKEASLLRVDTVAEALMRIRRGADPRWIVLAQEGRGEFTDADIAKLHAAQPMAQLLQLLGPWCEGEVRTGAPLSGVQRVYWHQWETRLRNAWRLRDQRRPPLRTWTTMDRALATNLPGRRPQIETTSRLAVAASSTAAFETLRDAFALCGWSAVWVNSPMETPCSRSPSPGLIWDASTWDAVERAGFQKAIQRLAPQTALLLVSWPRLEEIADAKQAGATDVLSKPYELDDLLGLLRQALHKPGRTLAS